MNPLSNRSVLVLLTATLGLVFALVFWFVRLHPAPETPMLWKEAPGRSAPQARPAAPNGSLL